MGKRQACVLLGVVLVAGCLMPFRAGAQEPSQTGRKAITITAIQAKLFFESKGTFSEDVLNNPGFNLWNTPIGEGSAGTPSSSTLVLVEVNGKANVTEHQRRLSFTAKYRSSTAAPAGKSAYVEVKRSVPIGFFGADGKSYVAFWLYDTGCTTVTLSARILGQAEASTMEKTIPFRCGE
jgi:hypothetical protein